MTYVIPFQIDEARPADKAKVLRIAEAPGMPDEVIRMMGLVDEPVVAFKGRADHRAGARLTPEEVEGVRESTGSAQATAHKFGCSVSTVHAIRRAGRS